MRCWNAALPPGYALTLIKISRNPSLLYTLLMFLMMSMMQKLMSRIGFVTKGTPASDSSRCRLLELPVELQLAIYELVVVQTGPLLLNCACNSSYRNCRSQMLKDEQAWDTGKRHPPLQPALTQTCRKIRELALPLFYSENVFRASYCDPYGRPPMLPPVIRWLRLIGKENRETLRHLYFYDRNRSQDRNKPQRLHALHMSEIFTEMNGKSEALWNNSCCAHLVSFGGWQRREGEIPLALEEGAKRLMMVGEP